MPSSSRSTLKTQKVSSIKVNDKQPSNIRSTSSRSRSSKRSLRSRDSTYVKHVPGWSNLKRQRLFPVETSTHDPVSSWTTPETLNRNAPGSSGEPSDTTSNIEFPADFHLLSSEIASSSEEIMALALSDKFGVNAAMDLAADLAFGPADKPCARGASHPGQSSNQPSSMGVRIAGENNQGLGRADHSIIAPARVCPKGSGLIGARFEHVK